MWLVRQHDIQIAHLNDYLLNLDLQVPGHRTSYKVYKFMFVCILCASYLHYIFCPFHTDSFPDPSYFSPLAQLTSKLTLIMR